MYSRDQDQRRGIKRQRDAWEQDNEYHGEGRKTSRQHDYPGRATDQRSDWKRHDGYQSHHRIDSQRRQDRRDDWRQKDYQSSSSDQSFEHTQRGQNRRDDVGHHNMYKSQDRVGTQSGQDHRHDWRQQEGYRSQPPLQAQKRPYQRDDRSKRNKFERVDHVESYSGQSRSGDSEQRNDYQSGDQGHSNTEREQLLPPPQGDEEEEEVEEQEEEYEEEEVKEEETYEEEEEVEEQEEEYGEEEVEEQEEKYEEEKVEEQEEEYEEEEVETQEEEDELDQWSQSSEEKANKEEDNDAVYGGKTAFLALQAQDARCPKNVTIDTRNGKWCGVCRVRFAKYNSVQLARLHFNSEDHKMRARAALADGTLASDPTAADESDIQSAEWCGLCCQTLEPRQAEAHYASIKHKNRVIKIQYGGKKHMKRALAVDKGKIVAETSCTPIEQRTREWCGLCQLRFDGDQKHTTQMAVEHYGSKKHRAAVRQAIAEGTIVADSPYTGPGIANKYLMKRLKKKPKKKKIKGAAQSAAPDPVQELGQRTSRKLNYKNLPSRDDPGGTVYPVEVDVDGQTFIGEGPTRNESKKMAAEQALLSL